MTESPPDATLPRLLSSRREPLLVLPNDAMRARRCPKAIVAVWAWEALFGTALAWPFAAIVQSAYGSHPRADAVLWEPGGLALLDLVVRRQPALGALVAHVATVVLLALVLGLLPSAALFACVGFTTPDRKSPTLRDAFLAAIPAFGPSAVLFATALVFDVSLGAAAWAGAGLADEGFERALGEVAADAIALSLVVACWAVAGVAGVLQEVGRAAVVRFRVGAPEGLRTALRALAMAPTALLWSWGWRMLASVVPVALGGLLAGRIGGRGGSSLIVLLVMHQLIILVRAALRASWFARAMRAVDAVGGKDPYRPMDR
jgi:hypothetical protein